ncbi:MAG: class II glutamine amidotransferase [Anaerolineae bacterium]
MCGLTGVLLYPEARSPEQWAMLQRIVTSNLISNEIRGREASGVVVIQRSGEYRLFKQPVAASTLVRMMGYREAMRLIDKETVCILGHTRMPTKGSRWHNVNNHPLLAGHVLGIHNGVIENDDLLFSTLGLDRSGEVDSEIIFRLQDDVDPASSNGSYAAHLQERILLLSGRFATLSVDLRRPTELLALKHLRPLCLHYDKDSHALFFSSRYVFLRKAFGRSVITEALDSGFGYCFDALSLPQLESQPACTFALTGG